MADSVYARRQPPSPLAVAATQPLLQGGVSPVSPASPAGALARSQPLNSPSPVRRGSSLSTVHSLHTARERHSSQAKLVVQRRLSGGGRRRLSRRESLIVRNIERRGSRRGSILTVEANQVDQLNTALATEDAARVDRVLGLVALSLPEFRELEAAPRLHIAAFMGHEECCRFLIGRAKANVGEVSGGTTAMHHAASTGHRDIVELLVEHGAEVDPRDGDGRTPLHHAAAGGHLGVIEALRLSGAAAEALDHLGESALHCASFNGHSKVVTSLIEKAKLKPSLSDNLGRTPLHWAALGGYNACVEALLLLGADVEARDNSGRRPLHWAAEGGQGGICEILCSQWKAVVDARDARGMTPLGDAVAFDQIGAARALMGRGAPLDTSDSEGQTLVHHCVLGNHRDLLELLLRKGAPVDARTLTTGVTPLHMAAATQPQLIEPLLTAGADIEARDNDGRTALHWAAGQADAQSAVHQTATIPEADEDDDDDDDDGDMALSDDEGPLEVTVDGVAPVKKTPKEAPRVPANVESIRILVRHGAAVNALDNSYTTPLDFAKYMQSAVVVDALQSVKGAAVGQDIVTNSAMKIQAMFLRRRHRRQFRKVRWAALRIQFWWRRARALRQERERDESLQEWREEQRQKRLAEMPPPPPPPPGKDKEEPGTVSEEPKSWTEEPPRAAEPRQEDGVEPASFRRAHSPETYSRPGSVTMQFEEISLLPADRQDSYWRASTTADDTGLALPHLFTPLPPTDGWTPSSPLTSVRQRRNMAATINDMTLRQSLESKPRAAAALRESRLGITPIPHTSDHIAFARSCEGCRHGHHGHGHHGHRHEPAPPHMDRPFTARPRPLKKVSPYALTPKPAGTVVYKKWQRLDYRRAPHQLPRKAEPTTARGGRRKKRRQQKLQQQQQQQAMPWTGESKALLVAPGPEP